MLDYLYDFGDDWEHQVSVEAVTTAGPDSRYPRCTGGQGACPPEDCGGIPGYQHLRDALAGPPAPEQEKLLEWLSLATPADSTRLSSHVTPHGPTPGSPRSPGPAASPDTSSCTDAVLAGDVGEPHPCLWISPISA